MVNFKDKRNMVNLTMKKETIVGRIDPPGGYFRPFGWRCAAGTLETLAYTRASSSEFCYPILD